jgi:hypothetical protein
VSGGRPGAGPGWAVSYQPGILQDMWEAIPPGMRLACFSDSTVPQEYLGGLAHQRGRAPGIDLSPLPEVFRRELAWCVFRIITQGGKVDVTHMRALVRRLCEVIADLGAAAPASLAGLTPREWQQHFALAVRRRTGALPGPGSVTDLRQLLNRWLQTMLRRGDPITFRGLAQTAGVSLDFLYRTPGIRSRVEQLRARQQATAPASPPASGADQRGSVIRTLTTQLAELKRRHRDEISALKQALEAAHGENLELRRRLGHQDTATPPC